MIERPQRTSGSLAGDDEVVRAARRIQRDERSAVDAKGGGGTGAVEVAGEEPGHAGDREPEAGEVTEAADRILESLHRRSSVPSL